MRTRKLLTMLHILACSACLGQAPESYSRDFKRALRYGAKAKLTIKVDDESGIPVTNANMKVFFRMSSGANDGERIRGTTDDNGVFTAEGRTTDTVFVGVEKPGCYTSRTQYNAQSLDPVRLKDGCWLPWNPTIPVVLREIRNPIPMYATGVDFAKAFPCDKDIGFDCEKRDWVDPHGTGEVADFIVRMVAMELPEQVIKEVADITAAQEAAKDRNAAARFGMDLRRIDRAYYKLVISSVDNDGGFIRKQKVKDSEFVSVYEAPEYGYTPSFETSMEKPPYYEPPNPNDLTGGEYLIFKSRIQRDSKGKIVSANYGKIYGPLEHLFSRKDNLGALKFHYYFNPTPNDRNLEFDTSKNLYKKAKGEHVTLNDKP